MDVILANIYVKAYSSGCSVRAAHLRYVTVIALIVRCILHLILVTRVLFLALVFTDCFGLKLTRCTYFWMLLYKCLAHTSYRQFRLSSHKFLATTTVYSAIFMVSFASSDRIAFEVRGVFLKSFWRSERTAFENFRFWSNLFVVLRVGVGLKTARHFSTRFFL